MQKLTIILVITFLGSIASFGQHIPKSFGKGINIIGKDSSYTMKFGVRFQTLYQGGWKVENSDPGRLYDFNSNFLIRRSRFKFNGYVYHPTIKYKMEFGLTNKDIGGGINSEHNNAPRFILDAFIDWNFYKNFSLKIGQSKLPGNRERVISSANLQLVDRSLLNKYYNIDRDIGVQLKHHFVIGKSFIVKEIFAFSQGEGRNITSGNIGGYDYTFRLEFLPFGKFLSKGDYIGGAIKSEDKPKVAIGLTYDANIDAPRERGQGGSFIRYSDGSYGGKTLNAFFADLMFKYQNLSIMAEYVNKTTGDGKANLIDNKNAGDIVGTYFIGSGLSIQAGWMFDKSIELSFRYTAITPSMDVKTDETEYTIGLSKYIVGHQLKIQTDLSYRQYNVRHKIENNLSEDLLFWRAQLDVHF